jgi:uncharacterized protein (TIGR00730 family)
MNGTRPPHRPRNPLAYKNEAFLDSDDARGLRILAEYTEPLSRFQRLGVQGTVVFFGSARLQETGPLARYYAGARELARIYTEWSHSLPPSAPRFLICSGGGFGIMEAANRGANEAGGHTIGLNISLPEEQQPNPYISPDMSFEFHYFFMRKLWFAHLARAVVVFPGGFGTLDEMSEILTLSQTRKLESKMTVLLYGKDYWNEILNFNALVRHGMIAQDDLELFQFVDTPDAALAALKIGIGPELKTHSPVFAKSRTHQLNDSYFYQRSGD